MKRSHGPQSANACQRGSTESRIGEINRGQLALDGPKSIVIQMVYLGPALIITIGGMVAYFAMSLALPMTIYLADDLDVGPFMLLFTGSMVVMFLSMAVGWLLGILGAIPLPLARANLAATGELAAAFRLREIWSLLKANWLSLFIVWTILCGLLFIWYLVIFVLYYYVILCWLVYLVTLPFGFYLQLVSAVLFGQVYREAKVLVRGE